MNDLLKYFHPENIINGTKSTTVGILIAVISTVAFFKTKQIGYVELLGGYLFSCIFLFAGPKKETNKDDNNQNHK